MLVQEVMIKKVIIINSNKTVFDACNLYKDYKVGCLIVTDDGKCAGIVTERDLIERTICLSKNPEKTKIEDIMSRDIKTIHPLDTIDKALDIMKENNIKKLPVVLNQKIVGIVTITDLSRARPDLSTRFIETWIKPRWID